MSDKIRVLMVGPDRTVHGGISGVVNLLYEAGLADRVQIKYIGTMKDGTKLKKLLVAIVAFTRFLCCVHKFDIVHVNMSSDTSYLRKSYFIKAAKKAGKKIVLHQHGGDIRNYYAGLDESDKRRMVEILSMPDMMLVLGEELRKFFATLVPNQNIRIFSNSIIIPEIYHKDYSNHDILFLGRLCKDKGIVELVEAMKDVTKKFADAKLYLGGMWEDKELESIVNELGNNVSFLGWVGSEEKARLLKECSIYVLPSYYEGQPVSVLEAMGYSLAVVATNVGTLPEMIISGESGVLIEPKDAKNLEEALLKLLSDEEYKKKIAVAGRKVVENRFNINNSLDQLCKIYSEITK